MGPSPLPGPLAVLELETPLERVIARLGEPTESGPDLGGTGYRFVLPGVDVWVTAADEPHRPVLGWAVHALPGTQVLAPAGDRHIELGSWTVADVLDAWGAPHTTAHEGFELETLTYTGCAGPWPLVPKVGPLHGGPPEPA
jgi:hypothetical protein